MKRKRLRIASDALRRWALVSEEYHNKLDEELAEHMENEPRVGRITAHIATTEWKWQRVVCSYAAIDAIPGSSFQAV